MSNMLWQVLSGIALGFFASFLFWRNLLLKKPNINISKYVLKYTPEFHKDRMTCAIRIINDGKRDVIDVKFHLRFRKFMPDSTRITISYPLLRDNLFYLASKKNFKEALWDITFDMEQKEFVSKMRNIFSTAQEFENLDKKNLTLEETLQYFDYLELLVACTDSESGVTKIFSQKYTPSEVIKGKYKVGTLEFVRLK